MHTHSLSIHPDSGRALRPWELALLLGVACAALLGVWLDGAQAALSDQVIRLHVLANSDSEADQALKLRVRDRILAEAEELFLHPLHPYTKALLSAVPIPDPSLEKHKKLLVYDPSIHDYSVDKPVWEEIANGHFVYGNQRELEGYRKEYESQL